MEQTEITKGTDNQIYEPQFIGKLRNKDVRIFLHSGVSHDGQIIKYNRYELLFKKTDVKIPIIIMKNCIAVIVPTCDENPFEKKVESPSKTEGS